MATYPEYNAWVMCCLLEVTFFVNAAGLFFLSALIEKSTNAKKAYGNKKEVTTLKMPPALIEGTEAIVLFTLIVLFSEWQTQLYTVFTVGVTITILQRLQWASVNL